MEQPCKKSETSHKPRATKNRANTNHQQATEPLLERKPQRTDHTLPNETEYCQPERQPTQDKPLTYRPMYMWNGRDNKTLPDTMRPVPRRANNTDQQYKPKRGYN